MRRVARLAVLGALLTALGAPATSARSSDADLCTLAHLPAGTHEVRGTAGNDTLRGTPGIDRILGKAGNDTILGRGGLDILCGGPGADKIVAGERATARAFDFIEPGPGNDTVIAGGAGSVFYSDAGAGISADLNTGSVRGGSGRDTLKGVLYLIGSNFDDVLIGASQGHGAPNPDADTIRGGDGNDTLTAGSGDIAGSTLEGEGGNDRLTGRGGANQLKGGPGNDVIVANGDPKGVCAVVGGCVYDRIDCGPGRDTVTADPKDMVSASCEVVHRK